MRTASTVTALALAMAAPPAAAQNVKITPVGSHPAELCANDRATIFEDPTGVRILYDAGHTVTGADDARLGDIHVVLLSHAHGDHIGDQKLKAVGAGTCANSDRVSAAPNSTTAEIAAAKNAAIAMTTDMGTFVGRKIQGIRGKPVTPCQGAVTTVPVAAPCRSNTHLGGPFIVKTQDAAQGVEITIVYASHANNVALSLLSEAQRASLDADGGGLVLGPPTGLRRQVYQRPDRLPLGDTGIHTEMKTVVNEFHKANLAVLNLGSERRTVVVGSACDERARPARVRDPYTSERGRDRGRQAEARLARGRADQGAQGADAAPRDQWTHHGIRRQGQMRRRMLNS